MKKKTLIIGGGAAGLAAAWRLARHGHEAWVIEMSNRPGGLSGGVEMNGNVYEYGPHLFHTTDRELLHDIKSLMGNELITFERTVKIKFMGEYFDFPLSIIDVLLKLPLATVGKSFFSFLYHTLRSSLVKPEIETTETVLLSNYGRVLYEIFFKSYIEQVWGYPPREFSPEFARQRIPRINVIDIMEKLWKRLRPQASESLRIDGYVEKIEGDIFTTRRGFSMIAEHIAEKIREHGGRVLLNARATELFIEQGRANHVRIATGGVEEILDCDQVISTIPINNLPEIVKPHPGADVQAAAEKLKFRATMFVGIVVNRQKVLRASFMYFRELAFNRIMDLSYFGIDVKPHGATILIAEVNCETSDFIWIDEIHAKEMVIKDLIEEGIIAGNEVLECHVFRATNAYPIYLLHFEKHLHTLLRWVEGIPNLQTIGRQGRFQYINSHVAMKMGYNAADAILKAKT